MKGIKVCRVSNSGGLFSCNVNLVNFEVSNLPHIFPVVEKYIQEQIMAKSNSHTQAVNDGLNALKNAYDDGFKKRLVNKVPEELLEPTPNDLKRGNANYGYKYFYFKSKEESYDLIDYLKEEIEDEQELSRELEKEYEVLLEETNKIATTRNMYKFDGSLTQVKVNYGKEISKNYNLSEYPDYIYLTQVANLEI